MVQEQPRQSAEKPEFLTRIELVGTQVHYLRRKMGWSQKELADKAGVEEDEVKEVESAPGSVRIDRMIRVMEALELKTRLSFHRASGAHPFAVELFLEEEDDPGELFSERRAVTDG